MFGWLRAGWRNFMHNTDVAQDYNDDWRGIMMQVELGRMSEAKALLELEKLKGEYRSKGMTERDMAHEQVNFRRNENH